MGLVFVMSRFSQRVVLSTSFFFSASRSQYDVLHDAVEKLVSPAQLSRLVSLVTFDVPAPDEVAANVTVARNANSSSINSSSSDDYPKVDSFLSATEYFPSRTIIQLGWVSLSSSSSLLILFCNAIT